MRRQWGWLSIVLAVGLLFAAACRRTPSAKESEKKAHIELEIVYKKNQQCYAISSSEQDNSLYSFNIAGQPVFDEEGQSVTARALTSGMIVSLEYDGYILETFPRQFSDVSEVRIIGTKSNDVEFLTSQISEMFPSYGISNIARWTVSFDGESFLNALEKRALEVILEEKYEGATVTCEPEQDTTDRVGNIMVSVNEMTESSVSLQIRVEPGLGQTLPLERSISASLQDGIWTI